MIYDAGTCGESNEVLLVNYSFQDSDPTVRKLSQLLSHLVETRNTTPGSQVSLCALAVTASSFEVFF